MVSAVFVKPYIVVPIVSYVIGAVFSTECVTSYRDALTSRLASVMSNLNNLCASLVPAPSVVMRGNNLAVIITTFAGRVSIYC